VRKYEKEEKWGFQHDLSVAFGTIADDDDDDDGSFSSDVSIGSFYLFFALARVQNGTEFLYCMPPRL
jgi:hypothetical protein